MDTKIIVITCVHDEEGGIERFLATCSLFADHIIIHDETTCDNTRSFYRKYPKAIVHFNNGEPISFDQRMLFVFHEARKIPCRKRIIIGLDADEILSSEVLASNEWATVLASPPKTLFHLQWVNLWKNPWKYLAVEKSFPGFANGRIWVDDDTSDITCFGQQGFHMQRLPTETAWKHVYLHEIAVLHYQFTDWHRMLAKHRWYRCREKACIRKMSNLGIFRMYGYMDLEKEPEVRECPRSWFRGWAEKGLDVTSVGTSEVFFYDLEVLKLMKKHGAKYFAYQDIWRVDWSFIIKKAKDLGYLDQTFAVALPSRRLLSKIILAFWRRTAGIKACRLTEKWLFGRHLKYRN